VEVRTVTPPAESNAMTALTLDVKLAEGPIPEAAAYELLGRAAARVSNDETVGVSFRVMRSSTATDIVDYTWCAATTRLIRWESPSRQKGGSLRSISAVAYADGVTSDDLERFGSSSERPAWRQWPTTGLPPVAK